MTHVNTEDYVSAAWRPAPSAPASLAAALSSLSVSDHSQQPEQPRPQLATFQRQHQPQHQHQEAPLHHPASQPSILPDHAATQHSFQPPLNQVPSHPPLLTQPPLHQINSHQPPSIQPQLNQVLSHPPPPIQHHLHPTASNQPLTLQPPSYQPPPPTLRTQTAAGKEDIKVIHFGVV